MSCSFNPPVEAMLHGECRISELGGLLQHREQVLAIVESEADEIAAKFGSPRCTVMSAEASSSMSVEDIIPNSQSLVVFSRKGYIKRIPADTFAVQHRGGRGVIPMSPSLLLSHPHTPCTVVRSWLRLCPPTPPPLPGGHVLCITVADATLLGTPNNILSYALPACDQSLTRYKPDKALCVALQYSTFLHLVKGHHHSFSG